MEGNFYKLYNRVFSFLLNFMNKHKKQFVLQLKILYNYNIKRTQIINI